MSVEFGKGKDANEHHGALLSDQINALDEKGKKIEKILDTNTRYQEMKLKKFKVKE